jgi:hypothetical protein
MNKKLNQQQIVSYHVVHLEKAFNSHILFSKKPTYHHKQLEKKLVLLTNIGLNNMREK